MKAAGARALRKRRTSPNCAMSFAAVVLPNPGMLVINSASRRSCG
jgi:hypothetical protein